MESQQNQKNSSVRHMLRILNAAKPYMAENISQSIEFISKAEDLFSTFPPRPSHKASLHAMELSDDPESRKKAPHSQSFRPVSEHTIEQMLTEVKKVCSPPEQASINTILNIIQARKLYQSYQYYHRDTKNHDNSSIFDFLKKQLDPEQVRTFELLKNAMM